MAGSGVAKAIQSLLPQKLPPTLSNRPATLFQVLSRFPQDGVGQRVYQTRWTQKNIKGCYWKVTRTQLKLEGEHGKAWGRLMWRGKQVNDKEELIRGGLKYKWAQGVSSKLQTQ